MAKRKTSFANITNAPVKQRKNESKIQNLEPKPLNFSAYDYDDYFDLKDSCDLMSPRLLNAPVKNKPIDYYPRKEDLHPIPFNLDSEWNSNKEELFSEDTIVITEIIDAKETIEVTKIIETNLVAPNAPKKQKRTHISQNRNLGSRQRQNIIPFNLQQKQDPIKCNYFEDWKKSEEFAEAARRRAQTRRVKNETTIIIIKNPARKSDVDMDVDNNVLDDEDDVDDENDEDNDINVLYRKKVNVFT